MAEFLVELYVSRADAHGVEREAQRTRHAAAALTAEGRPVRLVRSIFVPEDETCFLLVEAGSFDVVREDAQRAGLDVDHVAETVPDDLDDTA